MAPQDFSIDMVGRSVESLGTGGVGGGGRVSDAQVLKEMRNQGMEVGASEVAGAGDAKSGGGNFAEMLQSSFEQVNLHQTQADQAIKELVAGKSKNIHETMLAIERADASMKLMMQVRNKVLDAYREVMRMQV